MRFHCLQHVPFETPGILADRLRARGHSIQVTHLFDDYGGHSVGAALPSPASSALPSTRDFDGLIIMGGPMSIHDETEFPWLRAEKELISAAIRAEKKVLGICLGAQLIAAVSGARVYLNEQKEIGYFPVYWTEAAHDWIAASESSVHFPTKRTNKPSSHVPTRRITEPSAQVPTDWAGSLRELESLPVFHWHGETFDLPRGAILLASTKACINQAFLLGENTLGLQFHPEVTPAIVRDMITHEGHELVPAPYIQTAEGIQAQMPAADRLLDLLLDAFLHPITV